MLDPWDCAIGNVRIDLDLRRRRNGNGNFDGGNAGNVNIVRNVDIIRNVSDVGAVDNVRHAGNLGIVGNVWFRLEQRCLIVDANVNVTHNTGRRRSDRTSVGIDRDRQSWGQLPGSGTDAERISLCEYRGAKCVGTKHTRGYIPTRCFIYDDERLPVPNHRTHRNVGRLLK
jgi:hypothetical protein